MVSFEYSGEKKITVYLHYLREENSILSAWFL